MVENRNLILAIVLSVAILLGFQYFVEIPRSQRAAQSQATTATTGGQGAAVDGSAPGGCAWRAGGVGTGGPQKALSQTAAEPVSREEALAAVPRVTVEAPRVKGSINLVGGRIDDLTLTEYTETIDPDSPKINLLSPTNAAKPYYAQFGWVTGGGDVAVPDGRTVWQSEGDRLTPDHRSRFIGTTARGCGSSA